MNQTMQEDITKLATSGMIPWEAYCGSSVCISGATGLLGSQLALALDAHNKLAQDAPITVYALARNGEKAAKLFAECTEHLHIMVQDMTAPAKIEGAVDYVIHAASMTSSRDFVEKPVETIMTNLQASDRMLQLAKEKKSRGFLYLSSLEAYGIMPEGHGVVREEDSGYINQLSVRSSYSEGKRITECLCEGYASEYNVPVKLVRLCQTFGPGVTYGDGRVFAQFARSAIEGTDIVLKTKGETFRNYCYTTDAVTAMLTVLAKGETGEVYNIANKESGISIADMAALVAHEIAEDRIKVVFDIAEDATKLGYGPVIKLDLATEKLEALGWKAEVGLKESLTRLIRYMREIKE